jgi:hypothetical protein
MRHDQAAAMRIAGGTRSSGFTGAGASGSGAAR